MTLREELLSELAETCRHQQAVIGALSAAVALLLVALVLVALL